LPRRRRKLRRPRGGLKRRRRSAAGSGGESRSDVEAKLESEESTEMGGDASASEDKGDRGDVVTSAEHREPTAASVGGGHDTEMHGDVPESMKHDASEDTAIEREVKRTRSPRPSEASLAPHPLLRVWRSTPADWRNVFIPLHLQG